MALLKQRKCAEIRAALPLRVVCVQLGASRKTVVALLRRGTLKGFKVGRDWRVQPGAIAAFIRTQEAAVTRPAPVVERRPLRMARASVERLPRAGVFR